MSLYLCAVCGVAFDAPAVRRVRTVVDGAAYSQTEAVCPVCGGGRYFPAARCACGRPMWREDVLCALCRKDLQRRFTAFADRLTAEEEQQLDAWLEGDSVASRRRWR